MLAKIPLWVPFLFLALMFLGHRQSRTRLVPPGVVTGTAIGLLGLSLYGVIAAFGAAALPLLCWALGLGLALAFGPRLLGPKGLAMSGRLVQIPGSWWPLGLMMGIFSAKFMLGALIGMGSPIVHHSWFAVTAGLLFGLLSGAFTARAVVVQRFVAGAEQPVTARLELPTGA